MSSTTSPTHADENAPAISDLVRAGRRLLDEGDPVRAHSRFGAWVGDVAQWLEKVNGNSALSARWFGLPNSTLVIGNFYYDERASWTHFHRVVETRLAWLGDTVTPSSSNAKEKSMVSAGTDVFIAHGHNHALREACARLLERQGLKPIILHEQPNRGHTIVEKLESHTDVAFAVVLMTGDDEGRKANVPGTKLARRARQNVVFELGLFSGRLGRNKVCAIYEPGVEMPSDYSGIAYIEYDDRGAWRVDLLRELRAAGLPVSDAGLL
jgi:predicted nucleotide-binding protein